MISLVMPYYRNPEMLALHYRAWLNWPAEARQAIEVVIVDDGSPDGERAAQVPFPGVAGTLPHIRIFRITEDRPWHQHAARNLGAKMANAGWLLLTDMDHLLIGSQARILIDLAPRLDERTAYFIQRREADTNELTLGKDHQPKPHPNSFVLRRDLFWEVGGYDEDFCGHYGTDGMFRSRLWAKAHEGLIEDLYLRRFWRDLVPDASTRDVQRKEGREPGWRKIAMAEKEAKGRADQITTLDFEWVQEL